MLDDLVRTLAGEISGERALERVRSIVGFHRVQASPGFDQAADWLAGELEAAGLEVEIERAPGDGRTRCLGWLMPQGWECRSAAATLHGDGAPRRLADYAGQKLSLVLRSTAAQGRFPVLWLDDGSETAHFAGRNVRGHVVLTRGDVHRVHQLAVVERGAAGILSFGRRLVPPARTEDTDRDSVAYTSFWWGERETRGWGFAISPNEGERLKARLAAGARLELEVAIDARAFDTTIPLVSARHPWAGSGAPGEAGSGDEALIVSHLCHPQPSANDNGSGVAANLEAAAALARLGRRGGLPRTARGIRHLWIPEFTGTFAWLAQRGGPGARRLAAALNLDMVGEDQAQCGSTFLLEHPPCYSGSFAETLAAEIRERAVERAPVFGGGETAPVTHLGEIGYSGGSDHAVFIDPAIGVPCPMLIQWPDRFYHSSYDTPDRSDPRSLALAARCAAAYAAFVAAAGPRECDDLAVRIARRSRIRMLRAVGEPESERRIEAETLRARAALASLARLRGSAPAGAAESRALAGLEEFRAREIEPAPRPRPGAAPASSPPLARVPRRAEAAPLHYQRWLLRNWERLPRDAQERWRAVESGTQDASPLFELAWSLCDGTRSVGAISDLVWLESGRREDGQMIEFFDWTAALELSAWRETMEA